jgi:hypothetical protein
MNRRRDVGPPVSGAVRARSDSSGMAGHLSH